MIQPLLVELDPMPQTVLELFENHPERWTRSLSHYPGKRKGYLTELISECDCLCLGAAIGFIARGDKLEYHHADDEKIDSMTEKVEAVLLNRYSYSGRIPGWNDDPARTFEEVLAVVREAGV